MKQPGVPQGGEIHSFLRTKTAALIFGGAVLVAGCSGSHPSEAAPTARATGGVAAGQGFDASWPQCGETLPTEVDFAIIGANHHMPNLPNECYAEEMAQVKKLPGVAGIPGASVYVTAANPGQVKEQASFWPTSGKNAYGECHGEDSSACSYEYGRHNALQDLATINTNPPFVKGGGGVAMDRR